MSGYTHTGEVRREKTKQPVECGAGVATLLLKL